MYIVVNRECLVLSRTSPDALLTWERLSASAITFETHAGALKCADMQGGRVLRREEVAAPLRNVSVGLRPCAGPWVGGDSSLGVVL